MSSEKKILVTGGVGYIGSHTIVKLVEAGYSPIIIDNLSNSTWEMYANLCSLVGYDLPFYKIDLADETITQEEERLLSEVLIKGGVYGVIHFAGYKSVGESTKEPLKYYKNNIQSTINILRVMRAWGIDRIVFSSSATVYGEADEFPVNELTPRKEPTNPYGKTKYICEDILKDCVPTFNISPVILRYFNPIGAHPSGKIYESPLGTPENLVPYVQKVLSGEFKELTIFGDNYNTPDGTCIRDYIDVNDLGDAHIKALEACEPGEYKVYNIGSGNGSTVLDVVNEFKKAGRPVNYKFGDRRSGDVEKIYANTTKAKIELGWSPTTSLGDSIKSIVDLF